MIDLHVTGRHIIAQIDERSSEEEGIKITYRLYCFDFARIKKYAVYAETSDSAEIVLVGDDKNQAEQIYHLICKNSVTPCTLCDIVEDFDYNLD